MRKIIAILVYDCISAALIGPHDLFLFVSSFLFPSIYTSYLRLVSIICLCYHSLCLSQRTAGGCEPNLAISGKLKTLPDQYISLFYERLSAFCFIPLSARVFCLQNTAFVGAWSLCILRVTFWCSNLSFFFLSLSFFAHDYLFGK